jgi:hypothetical protein
MVLTSLVQGGADLNLLLTPRFSMTFQLDCREEVSARWAKSPLAIIQEGFRLAEKDAPLPSEARKIRLISQSVEKLILKKGGRSIIRVEELIKSHEAGGKTWSLVTDPQREERIMEALRRHDEGVHARPHNDP